MTIKGVKLSIIVALIWHVHCQRFVFSLEIKGNFAGVLDQKKLCQYPWFWFMVMQSGRANELQLNDINPGICAGAEVYIIMDHKRGELCFNFFSKCYGIFHAENNKSCENLHVHSLMHYMWIIQDYLFIDSFIVLVQKWKWKPLKWWRCSCKVCKTGVLFSILILEKNNSF